jgi:hypothetical protein
MAHLQRNYQRRLSSRNLNPLKDDQFRDALMGMHWGVLLSSHMEGRIRLLPLHVID